MRVFITTQRIRGDKMKMVKKAQAATEFIMTYGWAILVVLAAIGALAYFGVLSPDKLLPEKCQFPAGVDCIDKPVVSASAATVTLAMRNNIGYKMEILSVAGTDDCASPTLTSPSANTQVNNNDKFTLIADCGASLPTGRFKSDITISYINNETGLTHTATGAIRGSAS